MPDVRSAVPLHRFAPTSVGIVVPAHDEVESIDACLDALARAATRARVDGFPVDTYVVCDACTDGTDARVLAHGLLPLRIEARNVGAARSIGAMAAMRARAEWLAFTDADTIVSDTWLVDQLALGADAVCGTVGVADWGGHGEALRDPMRDHFATTYHDIDDHRHVHGANFGITADAYRRVGGFQPLPTSEDVALVDALLAADLRVAWSATPRVTTSARRIYRAPNGFGATLERVAQALRERALGDGIVPTLA